MKKSDIFFTVLVFVMFISFVNFKPDEKVELFEKELVKKESWLISELDNIASFMSFKESDHRYSNRQVLFDSRYASPEYDYIKIKATHRLKIEINTGTPRTYMSFLLTGDGLI